MTITVTDHRRDRVGLTYVYPVLSRRAGGLSIGINLNPNNACNWRCLYCQVPGLQRGAAPVVDLDKLEQELRGFLFDVLHGDFYQRHQVSPKHRTIHDIAISGNGEPTSASEFHQVVDLLGAVASELDLMGRIKFVLITNGSLARRSGVQKGIARLSQFNGEVWFKVDSATDSGIARINDVSRSIASVSMDLETVAGLCPTWIQTCVFSLDDEPPSEQERRSYLLFLSEILDRGIPLRGVLLYGIARSSMQPEASRLGRLSAIWLEQFATEIRELGIVVNVNE